MPSNSSNAHTFCQATNQIEEGLGSVTLNKLCVIFLILKGKCHLPLGLIVLLAIDKIE